jgi:hypothetical protein
MSKTTLPLALAIAACFILFQPAEAAAYCDTACTETTPCSRLCREAPREPFITCGDYGVCQGGGGTCNPNYQPVSGTPIGAFQVNYYFPISCDHIVVQNITWHDQNNCPGSADYTTCSYYINATRPDHLCCYYFWCGGQTSC